MLTEVRLTNFKSYDSQKVPLRRLTILVGPNNAGKSTLLQSILMLKQTFESKGSEVLVTAGSEVDLGTFSDILRSGSSKECLGVGLSTNTEVSAPKGFQEQAAQNIDLEFRREPDSHAALLEKATFSRDGNTLYQVARKDTGNIEFAGVTKDAQKQMQLSWNHFFPLVYPTAFRKAQSAVNSFQLFQFTSSTLQLWNRIFAGTWHVAPLRLDIPRHASLGKTLTMDVGTGGESLLLALHEPIERGTNRRLVDVVNAWINDHDFMIKNLKLKYLDQSHALFSLFADDMTGFTEVNVASMGKGVSQMLPILARVLEAGDSYTGIIEQPEIHLHPAAQAELADLFVDYISSVREGQLLIETHSEHLLLRTRRRIASGDISPEDVAVIYVAKNAEGSSSATMLDLNKLGQFENWPEGFFEEGLNEALAISKAADERLGNEARKRSRGDRKPRKPRGSK